MKPVTLEQIQRWLAIVEDFIRDRHSWKGTVYDVLDELKEVECDMLRQEAHGKEEQPIRR